MNRRLAVVLAALVCAAARVDAGVDPLLIGKWRTGGKTKTGEAWSWTWDVGADGHYSVADGKEIDGGTIGACGGLLLETPKAKKDKILAAYGLQDGGRLVTHAPGVRLVWKRISPAGSASTKPSKCDPALIAAAKAEWKSLKNFRLKSMQPAEIRALALKWRKDAALVRLEIKQGWTIAGPAHAAKFLGYYSDLTFRSASTKSCVILTATVPLKSAPTDCADLLAEDARIPAKIVGLTDAWKTAQRNGMQGPLIGAVLSVHHPHSKSSREPIMAWVLQTEGGARVYYDVDALTGSFLGDQDIDGYVEAYNAQWAAAAKALQRAAQAAYAAQSSVSDQTPEEIQRSEDPLALAHVWDHNTGH